VRLEDPCISQCVSVIKHFLEVIAAETGFVGLLADIALHIGRAGAQDEIKKILLNVSLDKAERAFVVCVYGII
jgi:hypothetical protein